MSNTYFYILFKKKYIIILYTRCSCNLCASSHEVIDQIELSKKVLYCFAEFATVIEFLIIKNRRIRAVSC